MKNLILLAKCIVGSVIFIVGIFYIIYYGGNWLATKPILYTWALIGAAFGFWIFANLISIKK